MKPIMIIPEGSMKPEDIQRLNDNDLCVVEAKEPGAVKFVDPIPAISSRTEIEQAAISLSRKVLNRGAWNDGSAGGDTHAYIVKTFVSLLVKGSPLDPHPSKQEREQEIFDVARADELRTIAREEARAERQAAKAAKDKSKEPKK